jgi:lipopolysaccharide transport protein LptA
MRRLLALTLAMAPLLAVLQSRASDESIRNAVAAGVSASASTGESSQSLDVESDRLDLDLKAKRALLEGHVRLSRGELRLTCEKLVIDYAGKEGALRVARAKGTGSVEIELRGAKALTPEADYDVDAQHIALKGPVRLLRDGGWVAAGGADVDVQQGRVTLTSVKASLPIGSSSAKP